LPVLLPDEGIEQERNIYARCACLLLANFNCYAFDYLARQKVQGQHLSWFVVEQLPVIAAQRFDAPLPDAFAIAVRKAAIMSSQNPHSTIADFVIQQVLALSYTAYDLAPFAQDLGYVNEAGEALDPFIWNESERRTRMAALDALFFYLYGLNIEDATYVMDTFPIVKEHDELNFGCYRTKQDVLTLLPLLN
jgi:hypothetical protein